MDGGALHADRLALQAFLGDLDARALLAHELGRRVVVLVGEVDLLLALFGDRHRRDDGVVLARLQGGNDAIPVLGDQLALHLHLLAERVGDVDVEADQLAVGSYLAERSEEHTSELQSLMRISYAVFCLKKKKKNIRTMS